MQFKNKQPIFYQFKEHNPFLIHKAAHKLPINTFRVNFLHVYDQYYHIHQVPLQNIFTKYKANKFGNDFNICFN